MTISPGPRSCIPLIMYSASYTHSCSVAYVKIARPAGIWLVNHTRCEHLVELAVVSVCILLDEDGACFRFRFHTAVRSRQQDPWVFLPDAWFLSSAKSCYTFPCAPYARKVWDTLNSYHVPVIGCTAIGAHMTGTCTALCTPLYVPRSQ